MILKDKNPRHSKFAHFSRKKSVFNTLRSKTGSCVTCAKFYEARRVDRNFYNQKSCWVLPSKKGKPSSVSAARRDATDLLIAPLGKCLKSIPVLGLMVFLFVPLPASSFEKWIGQKKVTFI